MMNTSNNGNTDGVIIERLSRPDEKEAVEFINNILNNEFASTIHHLAADDLDCLCETYKGDRELFLVLKNDSGIAGTIGIKEDSKRVALMRRLFVSADFRNNGYGSLLVKKAIEFCEQNNYEMICFRGNNQMDHAAKVIEKFGFIKKDILDFGAFHIYIYVKLL